MFVIHESVILDVLVIHGRGHRPLPGGVGMPGPRSPEIVQGCDVGDLWEPGLLG